MYIYEMSQSGDFPWEIPWESGTTLCVHIILYIHREADIVSATIFTHTPTQQIPWGKPHFGSQTLYVCMYVCVYVHVKNWVLCGNYLYNKLLCISHNLCLDPTILCLNETLMSLDIIIQLAIYRIESCYTGSIIIISKVCMHL